MVWDKRFLRLMPRTVGLRKLASRDRYGKPTYGTAQECRARVLDDVEETIDVEGEQRAVSGVLWMPPTYADEGPDDPPTTDDAIVLHSGLQVKILRVQTLEDGDGVHHYKVWYV